MYIEFNCKVANKPILIYIFFILSKEKLSDQTIQIVNKSLFALIIILISVDLDMCVHTYKPLQCHGLVMNHTCTHGGVSVELRHLFAFGSALRNPKAQLIDV